MRTRIVRRFLWSAFVLFTISLFGVDLYVTHVTSNNEIEDLRAALTTQARMLAAQLPAAGPHFVAWVKTAAALRSSDRTAATLAHSEPNTESAALLSVAVPVDAAPAATLKLSRSLDPILARAGALRLRLLAVSLLSLALAAGLAFIFVESFSRQISS